jgi:hypothetical protein
MGRLFLSTRHRAELSAAAKTRKPMDLLTLDTPPPLSGSSSADAAFAASHVTFEGIGKDITQDSRQHEVDLFVLVPLHVILLVLLFLAFLPGPAEEGGR